MSSRKATVLTNVGKSLGRHGEVLLAALREGGHRVLSVSRRAQALQLAADASPDLVLLNPRRPRMDGISLCSALRELPATAATPIVLIASKATEAEVLEAFEAGATDYITAPSRPKEALARLERHLSETEGEAAGAALDARLSALPALVLEMDEKGTVHALDGAPGVVSFAVKRRKLAKPTKATSLFHRQLSLALMDAVHQAATRNEPVTTTCRCGSRDREGWVELAVAPAAHDDERQRFVAIAHDVTERKRAEEDRLDVERKGLGEEKSRGIEQLAVGISHDFNNILSVIMGLASSCRADFVPIDPRLDDVESILAACRRGYDLTSKLSCVAGDVSIASEPLSLNRELVDVLGQLSPSIPDSVEVETTLEPAGGEILGDPVLIHHILVSLVNNAVEAMRSGGKLALTTRLTTLDDSGGRSPTQLEPGRYVVLTVADSGEGMPPSVKARALEPFFSTRSGENRSGLGLAVANGIARSHGGALWLESSAGKGTVVTVLLPADEAVEAIAIADVAERRSSVPPVAATALLIDDDELILYATRRLLQRLGYTVLVARSGAEGVETFQDRQDEITVVLLDLLMPGMDGAATFRKLREIDPFARIILCTGYSDGKVVSALEAEGLAGVLKKPFELTALTAILEATAP